MAEQLKAPRGYPHSQALDGVRGLFMMLFMAFHFGLSALVGVWTGLTFFFVQSAFLLTRLLTSEQERWGRIAAMEFYRRRVRRLLPALLALLAAVTAYALVAAPQARRAILGGDILASLGFVMNWRLIARGDDYFDTFSGPSPLRHLWTLAIEEQFYVVLPVLLTLLFLLGHTRRARVAILGVIAALLTWWMARVGVHSVADHTRAYYGTDMRAVSLVLGVAAGMWFAGERGRRAARSIPVGTMAAAGWVSLLLVLVGFVLIPLRPGWMWNSGGLTLYSLLCVVLVVATADERSTSFTRALGQQRLAWLGRRAYALYLWHWPVHLVLSPSRLGGSVLIAGLASAAVTIAIAGASWRNLEEPVLKRGFAGLAPRLRRPAAVALVPVVLVAAAAVSLTRVPAPELAAHKPGEAAQNLPPGFEGPGGPVGPLVDGQVEYTGAPTRIGIYGDSVPTLLQRFFPATTYPGVKLVNVSLPGCDIIAAPVRYVTVVQAPDAECLALQRDFAQKLKAERAEALIVFPSALLVVPHDIDGVQGARLGNPAYNKVITDRLDVIRTQARAAGVEQVLLVNVPCRALPEDKLVGLLEVFKDPELAALARDPVPLNALLKGWADGHPDTAVLDIHQALCGDGFHDTVKGEPVFADLVHYSPGISPRIWTWLLGQTSHAWASRPGATP